MQTVAQAAYAYALGQIGDVLEVMPGEEFRVAVQEAQKVSAVCLPPSCMLEPALLTERITTEPPSHHYNGKMNETIATQVLMSSQEVSHGGLDYS